MIDLDPCALIKDFHPTHFTAFTINLDHVACTPCFTTSKVKNKYKAEIEEFENFLKAYAKVEHVTKVYDTISKKKYQLLTMLKNKGEYFNLPTRNYNLITENDLRPTTKYTRHQFRDRNFRVFLELRDKWKNTKHAVGQRIARYGLIKKQILGITTEIPGEPPTRRMY